MCIRNALVCKALPLALLVVSPASVFASVQINGALHNAFAMVEVKPDESSAGIQDQQSEQGSGNGPHNLEAIAHAMIADPQSEGTAQAAIESQIIEAAQTTILASGGTSLEFDLNGSATSVADTNSSLSVDFSISEDTPFDFTGNLSFDGSQFVSVLLTDNSNPPYIDLQGNVSNAHVTGTLPGGMSYTFTVVAFTNGGPIESGEEGAATYDVSLLLNPTVQGVVPEPASLAVWSLIAVAVACAVRLRRSPPARRADGP
jgi:hypothetical protein